MPAVSSHETEAALRYLLSRLEPLVGPGVCIALTPRGPWRSTILEDLAALLARSRIDARGWITAAAAGASHVLGRRARATFELARAAYPLIRGARVLVLDDGGAGSIDRLTACGSLLLGGGAAEAALLALDRPM